MTMWDIPEIQSWFKTQTSINVTHHINWIKNTIMIIATTSIKAFNKIQCFSWKTKTIKQQQQIPQPTKNVREFSKPEKSIYRTAITNMIFKSESLDTFFLREWTRNDANCSQFYSILYWIFYPEQLGKTWK